MSLSNLVFRLAEKEDRQKIRELHEDWFPVRYDDEFFEAIAKNEEDFDKDNSIEAEVNSERNRKKCIPLCIVATIDERSREDNRNNLVSSFSINDDSESDSLHSDLENGVNNKRKIVGCIVSVLIPSTRNRSVHDLIIDNSELHSKVMYIMTVGTVDKYRRLGIGQRLVKESVREIERNTNCGAVYLHVITYNKAAIKFYQGLDFELIKKIKGE